MGKINVLSFAVANLIAAGEVVDRPASVIKELMENAIDAGARKIAVSLIQGGRKLVAVQDDGCGMTREDAVLALERQATSKILEVGDIEAIDTLGFRGEAIPSIASVSRFSLTTRRADADEGTFLQVNAGVLAEVRAAGCPPGTRVEVRDLFCNVPARRKFLRTAVTEENHIKSIFTVHALAHPELGFSLTIDNRELYQLAPAGSLRERVRELFGEDFLAELLPLESSADAASPVSVSGLIERPNLNTPTRRDQFIFVNGRPASAACIAYALKEAYPRRAGDSRPAAILFLELPPQQVDVNVHPTKPEVRFRDNPAVKAAVMAAIEKALAGPAGAAPQSSLPDPATEPAEPARPLPPAATEPAATGKPADPLPPATATAEPANGNRPQAVPVQVEFAVDPDSRSTRPWQWFKFLAQADSGYLLIETDAGIVTINPHAARERIAYEKMLAADSSARTAQTLLIPETIQLSPVESARLNGVLPVIRTLGFEIEPFGHDRFKIDAMPQLLGKLSPAAILATIARDLAEHGAARGGERWREELIAKSIARSFAGSACNLTQAAAETMVEELCRCRMPYVCPRGKPVMIFTSTRELDRKFDRR